MTGWSASALGGDGLMRQQARHDGVGDQSVIEGVNVAAYVSMT